MDFVAEDMPVNQAAAQRNKLRVQFYKKAEINEAKTEADGMPVWEDRVFIKKLVPGDPTSIVDTLAIINKRHPNADNNLFPEQYAAFLRNESQDSSGIPLSEFPALVDSQRKTLAYLEVKTVEQLADLPDDAAQRLMGGHDLRRKAKDFLKAREDNSHVLKMSAELAKRDAEIERMKSDAEARFADMAAKFEALKAEKKTQPESKK